MSFTKVIRPRALGLSNRIGSRTPLNASRKRVKREKLPTIAKLKKQLWEAIKAEVRKRDKGVCQACGATGLEGSNAQTSHLIASSICGGYLRYDLRNLYLCCFRCNISLSGNIAELYRNVQQKHGQAFLDQLHEDKHKIIQLDRAFLSGKLQELVGDNFSNK